MFDPNSIFLFILAGLVIVFVIAQSVFFLVRAWRRGRTLGMDMKQIKKTILSTAIFTFAPAVSILLGVITLSKFLGLPLPWLRLSVIGAITYELPAATTTANALGITALSETITDPQVYTAIAWVMTLGIFPGLIWVPLFIRHDLRFSWDGICGYPFGTCGMDSDFRPAVLRICHGDLRTSC